MNKLKAFFVIIGKFLACVLLLILFTIGSCEISYTPEEERCREIEQNPTIINITDPNAPTCRSGRCYLKGK